LSTIYDCVEPRVKDAAGGSSEGRFGGVIDTVEVLVLSHRLSRERLFGTGSNSTRDSLLVRVADGDGVVGWGETFPVPGAREAAEDMAATLIGRDPDDAAADLATRGGLHRWAQGAVAVAVDDLRARRRGIPLGALYRPRIRDRVEAYASSRGYAGPTPAAGWHQEARQMHDAGFRAMKFRIGRYPVPQEVAAVGEVVRDGPAFEWMADGNGAYGFDDALRVGRAFEELGLRWLEEPLPTGDYMAYAPLAAALEIPLSGGEIIERPSQADEPLAAGAFDIVQPDVSICGGVAPLLEIADRAAEHRIAVIPHACNGGVLLAATLQVLAVLPTVASSGPGRPILEYDVGENPLRTDVLAEPIPVVDGWVTIPDRPGLGIEVDEAAIRRLVA
jgi:D-galactarolactone cycloisomerase